MDSPMTVSSEHGLDGSSPWSIIAGLSPPSHDVATHIPNAPVFISPYPRGLSYQYVAVTPHNSLASRQEDLEEGYLSVSGKPAESWSMIEPVTAPVFPAFPGYSGYPLPAGRGLYETNFNQENLQILNGLNERPMEIHSGVVGGLDHPLDVDGINLFPLLSNESTSWPLPNRLFIERPPFPPNILKEELTFKERLFDGNYSDVHRAEWKGQMVAVKVLRSLRISAEAMDRKRRRELETWWELDHPSILPLLGFIEDIEPRGPLGAMVSPYCAYGNASAYLRRVPLTYHAKITLWLQVIEGIAFIHTYTPTIVHGDLKPANIVIDDDQHARICDFGLSRLVIDHGGTGLTTTTAHTGTIRYNSPELCLNSRSKPTTESDVYALGCLGLEFIFSKRPYDQHEGAMSIIGDIQNGYLPARRPKHISGEIARLWHMLSNCWDQDPSERPNALALRFDVMVCREDLAAQLESHDQDQ